MVLKNILMDPGNLMLFVFLALLAEIAGTVGGFGSSLFFVPIASYFFDFHSVLGITALFHVASNLSKIALFKKGFDKNIIINIGIPAVLFVIGGSVLSKFIETKFLEIFLSVFLISVSVILLFLKNFTSNQMFPIQLPEVLSPVFLQVCLELAEQYVELYSPHLILK